MKRRLLRILGIGLAVLLFTGYFAFSTFVFSPLEGDYEFELSTLVPRDVDVYASKPGLAGDFASFPRLAFEQRLAGTERGERFLASPEWSDFEQSLGLAQAEAETAKLLEQLPIPIDPIAVAGGRELAFASYASAPTVPASDWAVYLRTNWVGKLGVAALDYPDLIGLGQQGLSVESFESSVRLSGGQLDRPLFVTRLRDVVIVSSAERMITAAYDLVSRKGEDSLGQSATYYDNITRVVRDEDELRVAIDYSDAAEKFGWPMQLESAAAGPAQKLLARYLQPALIRELTGIVGFKNGLSASIVGEIDPERLSALQKRAYRKRDADGRRIAEEVARFAPADCGLFAYIEADIGDLLTSFFQVNEPALRSNFESEVVRQAFDHSTLDQFIAELDGTFDDRLAVILRPNDFPPDPTGPPNDGLPTFAYAIVLWTSDQSKVDSLRDDIVSHQPRFGISNPAGDSGVFTRDIEGGNRVYEYWAPLVPGTGHVASLQDQDFLVVANHALMLQSVIDAYYTPEAGTSLANRPEFQILSASGLPAATVSAWIDPSGLGETLIAMTADQAQFAAEEGIDWNTKRRELEQQVLRTSFSGETLDSIGVADKDEFERLVEVEVDRFRQDRRAQIVPQLVARTERRMDAFELLSCALIQLRLEQKSFEFSAQLDVPLTE
ncbi:MAG: hypothetical protein AAFZ65_04590 [Planctomycetota bacterium]